MTTLVVFFFYHYVCVWFLQQETCHFFNVNNSIFFWQDLAANGTNLEVTEAAKAHLDSYRYKPPIYAPISNTCKVKKIAWYETGDICLCFCLNC